MERNGTSFSGFIRNGMEWNGIFEAKLRNGMEMKIKERDRYERNGTSFSGFIRNGMEWNGIFETKLRNGTEWDGFW